ncbi:hypothetical protein RB195_019641 [Necator americanus]|uniref:Uncharacterized protein n=1 Tax=Necator americanus TaxID=51031 RepID=A0ABR1CHB4_NECAM
MSDVSNSFSAWETLPEDEPPLCIAVRRPVSPPRHYEAVNRCGGERHKVEKKNRAYQATGHINSEAKYNTENERKAPKGQIKTKSKLGTCGLA